MKDRGALLIWPVLEKPPVLLKEPSSDMSYGSLTSREGHLRRSRENMSIRSYLPLVNAHSIGQQNPCPSRLHTDGS